MTELKVNDYADNLLVLNKTTIDKLCSLDEAFNCIALYIFYYKTAKWQKTDTVKANDSYVEKTLKIGKSKLTKTKKILQNNGLIEIIQKRENGKVSGWYIRVHFLVNNDFTKKIKVESINNHQNEQGEISTCGKQDTNALRINIKCLKNKIKVLKEENNKLKSLLKESGKLTLEFDENLFNKFWNTYPKKKSKGNVEKWFKKHKPSSDMVDIMVDKINQLKETEQWNKNDGQFIPYPTTWLNAKGWEDEISNNETIESEDEEIARLKAEVERRKVNGEW